MHEVGITRVEVDAFFERFVSAFATFDGYQVADLFAVPAVACRKDGALLGLATREEVVDYYQAALDDYRRGGCTSCEWHDLQMMPMGTHSIAAAVNWRLLRADNSILAAWRQTYCLLSTDGGLKSFAATTHAP